MNSILRRLLIIPSIFLLYACNAPGHNDNTVVSIKTTLGDIKIKLYDETPVHRDNFIKLVNEKVYDNVTFHRVIKDFMIQAGDPSTRPAGSPVLPDSVSTYTIPAEFNTSLYHKRGSVAAARRGNDENPEMRSSGTQFYIVQGKKYTDPELDQIESRINSTIKQSAFTRIMKQAADSLKNLGNNPTDAEIQDIATLKMFNFLTNFRPFQFTEEQRTTYKTEGGAAPLDGTYTVFGEVIEGIEVVDKIASVSTDSNDRPVNDIRILKIKISGK